MNNEITTIHNLLILDESGSMRMIYKQALSGANETIQTVRAAQEAHPELDQRLTFVTFNTAYEGHPTQGNIRTVFNDVPIEEVRDLTYKDYNPNACTPLYDAMGTSITALERKFKEGDRALVTIITDGLENASKEYNQGAIKAMVDRLREKGWTFVYIGANQDAVEVAKGLSINNHMAYESDPEGAERMFRKVMSRQSVFYSKIVRSKEEGREMLSDENFFAGEESPEKK
jgi:hypothetical protein